MKFRRQQVVWGVDFVGPNVANQVEQGNAGYDGVLHYLRLTIRELCEPSVLCGDMLTPTTLAVQL